MQKYNWFYNVSGNEENLKMEVIPSFNERKQLPACLFKVYSLNSNSIDSLLNSYIYASHPSEFNDIYDCHRNLIIYDDIDILKAQLSNFLGADHEFIIKINKEKSIELASHELFYQLLYSYVGLFSMTENPENIMLWTHYCNNKGFAIEFNLDKLKKNFISYGPFQINYQKEINQISIKEGIASAALFQSNIKYINWSYENEWRLLIQPKKNHSFKIPNFPFCQPNAIDRKVPYKIDAIKCILLGNLFFENSEMKVINDRELEINIYKDTEKKICVLNFIYDNNINAGIALKNNTFSNIELRFFKLEKLTLNKFKLIALEI